EGFFRAAKFFLTILFAVAALNFSRAQEIRIENTINVLGQMKPIPVALDGFTGEARQVLEFDLFVQGFSFVSPEAAQYLIHGSDAGDVTGSVTDKFAHKMILSRSYNGASLRRQAHAFADDIVKATTSLKAIGQTKIAFKSQSPGGNRDIFYHSLSSGQRRVIAGYSGLNTSAAVSPDGAKVAMILSKAGSPNVWVCNADGTNLKRLTTGIQDSSPCWSPNGEWICFATEKNGRRRLAKIPAGGGGIQYLDTTGAANPTEPDWSPDGKWIAFTRQAGDFDICVMPADGGMAPVVLVPGQNPSWAPNSRTLVFNHGGNGHQTLSVLDVFTKQYKDCRRATGSNSQPAWAR